MACQNATPYLQQQNYSLAALDARDKAGPIPPAAATPAALPPSPALPSAKDVAAFAAAVHEKSVQSGLYAA